MISRKVEEDLYKTLKYANLVGFCFRYFFDYFQNKYLNIELCL